MFKDVVFSFLIVKVILNTQYSLLALIYTPIMLPAISAHIVAPGNSSSMMFFSELQLFGIFNYRSLHELMLADSCYHVGKS